MILSLIKMGLRYLVAHPDKALLALDELEAVVKVIETHYGK